MTSGQVIDAYLGEVAAALTGPPRARADIVAELRSGLLDAADAHRSAGLAAAPAAEAAIGEFGDPRQVAAAFRPELTLTQARRLALTLVATGPLIGLLPGGDLVYGLGSGWLKELAGYWRTGYDRRRHEARVTSHPQFTTTIDGQNIHFPHAAREAPDVLVSDIGDFSRKVC
jgi:Epoxide hydrolase N terminus/HAAS